MARPVRRLINTLYYGPPIVIAGIGIYCLYRAAQLDGSAAERAFGFGLVQVLCAVLFVAARRSRVRAHEIGILEAGLQSQGRRLRRLEKGQEALAKDLESWDAATAVLKAVDRYDAHKAGGWVHLNRPDT